MAATIGQAKAEKEINEKANAVADIYNRLGIEDPSKVASLAAAIQNDYDLLTLG
jgi:hypothetical protein